MAKCYYHYPWRNVIITIHGEMLLLLSMARCYYYYPWRDVIITIHGEVLSMARCYYYYPWLARYYIHGEMLSMARCYFTIHGAMLLSLSMARCYPWRVYPWRGVITTIYSDMLYQYPWRYFIHGKMSLLLSMVSWVKFSNSLSDNSPSDNTFKMLYIYIYIYVISVDYYQILSGVKFG